jgi:triacylglycerol lipase
MLWFRNHYLPRREDWANPEASPLLYPADSPTWKQLPRAVVIVGELDVLREEGEQYAAKLKNAGVKTELHVMKRQGHPFLAMDGVLEAGRQAITFMVEGCKLAFY